MDGEESMEDPRPTKKLLKKKVYFFEQIRWYPLKLDDFMSERTYEIDILSESSILRHVDSASI